MFAIIDSRSSEQAINNLNKYVTDVYTFQTNGVTGNSISGHPDIFIYQDKDQFVVAPNAPVDLFKFLDINNIAYLKGHHKDENCTSNLVLDHAFACLGKCQFCSHENSSLDLNTE